MPCIPAEISPRKKWPVLDHTQRVEFMVKNCSWFRDEYEVRPTWTVEEWLDRNFKDGLYSKVRQYGKLS